jgi:hypothetical protein
MERQAKEAPSGRKKNSNKWLSFQGFVLFLQLIQN